MNVSALDRTVTAANLPLEKLAGSTQVGEREKIAEVSRQFEAVLLRQILAQSQKPLFQSSSSGGGASSAIYQDMLTQQLADRISHGGSFGFAKVLDKQLASQYIKKDHAAPLKPLGPAALNPLHPPSEPGTTDKQPMIKTHHVRGQPGKRI